MRSRFSSLILLLYIQGSLALKSFPVICHKQIICDVRGDQVTLSCFYSNINITTGFWFSQKQSQNWREKDEPEDLTLDLDYSGRVNQRITGYDSHLTISDLRERDSGEYQLMFIMKDGVKHFSSVTVNLTVTVLQVRMILESTGQKEQTIKLICDSSCNLTSGNIYYWYMNGQFLKYDTSKYIFVPNSGNSDSYSCSVHSDMKNPFSVCVSNSSCWNVIYASRRVCALVGSTIDIHSTYSHPTGYTVEKTYWHYIDTGGIIDLSEKQQFAGRVEYLGNTLRIKDVEMSDSGEYRFRFITDTSEGRFSGSPGVILTVTDTQVKHSSYPEEEKVILSCSTKCTLDNKYTYIWYKNGQQVTDGFTLLNKLYLDSIGRDELQDYSCAIGDINDISVFGHHTVCLLVFLPQFLIIGAVWMWFFISMNKLKGKNKTDVKQEESCITSAGVISYPQSEVS